MVMQTFKKINISALASQDAGEVCKLALGIQANVEEALIPLLKAPMSDGIFLRNIAVGTADTFIPHKLNRKYISYFLCRQDAQTDIWSPSRENDDSFVVLRAGVAATVDLWVF
jgi:hypothetical protein